MRVKIIIPLLAILFLVQPAMAALDLELTQGVKAAIPVAVMPFANESLGRVPGDTTISTVIKKDLQNSGQFRIKEPGVFSFGQQPMTLAQVNFNYWRKQGINDLIIGQVHRVGLNEFKVSFQLISIFNKSQTAEAQNPQESVLLSQSFIAPQAGLRKLAHHISNLIYQQITGVRGVFSTKICYVLVQELPNQPRKFSLILSDYDGFNAQALLVSYQPIVSPAWSPDGKNIAYVSFEGHEASIYLQSLATGKRRLISRFPGVNSAPAFSPDGKKLALVLTKTGNLKIYTLNLQTQKLTRITDGYSIDTEPNWSPDGKSIIFTSNRGGTPQIYRYYFANQRTERVTFEGNYNARASFFPNDEQDIILTHRETGIFGIARQNLTDGQLQVLVETGNDESPSIAPNGKMIVYATQYGNRGVLGMVSSDGQVKLRIPAKEGNVQNPAWSPFLS